MRRSARERDYDVGYGKAPSSTRFKKGQSGNPKGRPKGSKNLPPYETILGQVVVVKEDGVERRMTAAEAFLLHMTKRGLDGDGAAARAAMAVIEEARSVRVAADDQITVIIWKPVAPGSVNEALEPLKMATKLDRFRPTARIKLEAWLVEAALARLGSRRLTRDEQATVVQATRIPAKVQWPEWWEIWAS